MANHALNAENVVRLKSVNLGYMSMGSINHHVKDCYSTMGNTGANVLRSVPTSNVSFSV